MIVACDRFAYPLVKENSVSHFLQIPAFKLRNRIFRDTPPNIGTRFECRVSAAGYLPRKRENNQLRGIGGLVIRLYLGFYIPLRKEFGSSKFEPYSSR